MIRALIAERHPTHAVLGEELGGPSTPAAAIWLCDPIDGTTNFAHGLPVFCSSLALEVDGELEVGAVYDPMRDELFTASRGGGAFLNGAPAHRVARGDADRLAARHRISVLDAAEARRDGRPVRAVPVRVSRRAPPRLRGAGSLLRRRRTIRRVLGRGPQRLGHRGRRAARAGGRRAGDGSRQAIPWTSAVDASLRPTGSCTTRWRGSSPGTARRSPPA